jgi:hypothetical protein
LAEYLPDAQKDLNDDKENDKVAQTVKQYMCIP